jgi:hypothetical protein
MPESPYQAIITRNAFGLKTPPPPPPPPEQPAQQISPSALKLTGIITFLGGRRATFVLQEPGKPQINSDLVREGEKDGMITNLEVLQIDERAGLVRVAYAGKEMALDFVNNGLKPPAAPAGPAPGTPGAPGAVAGRPAPGGQAGVVAGPQFTAAGPGGVQSAVRSAYQPAGSSVSPAAPSMLNSDSSNPSGLRSIPVRPTRLSAGASTAIGAGTTANTLETAQPTQPPEQQALLMRVQEEISRRQGMAFPPTPPIPGMDTATPTGPPALPGQ